MKRNYFKYTAIVFFTFIIALISAGNVFSFDKSGYVKLTIQKSNLTINASPLGHHNFSEENVFEKETEDKTETTFNAALPVFNSDCHVTSHLFPPKQPLNLSSGKSSFDVQHSLYLAICSFRI
ncbi:MAG: hypothetical protein ACXVPN_03715 [Bacteroidia bacterium]